ncbi:hypothetical protein RHECNPAF_1411009 [Rhizobium etli CNPAF512]|nr:hypothetical protein RHECNPAF_1411009 [Rhizobium etli CNPAF512]
MLLPVNQRLTGEDRRCTQDRRRGRRQPQNMIEPGRRAPPGSPPAPKADRWVCSGAKSSQCASP